MLSNHYLPTMRRFFSVRLLITTFLLFQALMLPVLSYNTLQAEQKKIILQNADVIEGGEGEAGSYRSVSGNVVFQDGSMTLKCDSAIDYERENKVVLKGNIVITDTAFAIYGDNGVYFPDKQTGELQGSVRGRMFDNSLFGKAQRAVVNKATGQTWLYDQAIAWHEQQQISGDSILLHFTESGESRKKQSIDEIQVQGSAFFAAADTLSRSPVVYNQFGGKKMVIRLKEGSKIDGITVTGQAELLYYLYDEQQQPSGINYSSGDMIRMFFTGGTLNQIKVTGNVEGKQYPVRFRGDTSINLAKFAWRERENPFREQKSLP
jgi:lipopolysaccharide export system protein LptA